MRKQLLILSLLLSTATFPSLSFGDWTSMGATINGNEFFLDFEQTRVYQGLVYFTYLQNSLKPDEFGTLSATSYVEANCATLGRRVLSVTFYKQSMARGREDETINPENPEIKYSSPGSMFEFLIKEVCGRYNLN